MPNSRFTLVTDSIDNDPIAGNNNHNPNGTYNADVASGSVGYGGSSDPVGSLLGETESNTDIGGNDLIDTTLLDDLRDWMSTNVDDAKSAAQNQLDPLMQLLYYMKGISGGDRDALMQIANQIFEYLQNEQNYQRNYDYSELTYQRSLASNQVALMQAAGMSRSAALSALQGGSNPQSLNTQGVTSPLSTNIEGNRSQQYQNILDTIDTSTRLANQLVSLASSVYDIKAKQITLDILSNQDNMLDMQLQGMQDAAMFAQAVANVDADHHVSQLPIYEQFSYFQKASKMLPGDEGFNQSAFYYGNSANFARCASNPYFWAAYSDAVKNVNQADASIYDPARAQQEVAQLRAGVAYTNDMAFNEKIRSSILGSQAFIDSATAQVRKDMEICKAECEKAGYTFDKDRAERFIQRIDDFTALDFKQLDLEIKRVTELLDHKVYIKERNALVNSLDYNAANYLYNHALVEIKRNGIESLNLQNPEMVSRWVTNYFKFREFGQTDAVNAGTNIARTIFSGLTATAAGTFAGWKIYQGFNAAKAAQAAATAAGTTTPPVPFNLVTPLIVSEPLLNVMQPQIKGLDMYSGIQ